MTRRNTLRIVHARENTLKGVTLELEHDTFVGVTGLSGSGKSSLAFDTVYAEGQRRYIETFSPYTRQFFDKVKRPRVDQIENVRPAIAIQQRTRILNSRSTVGSMTDINDYLKILWSNIAVPVCPRCGRALQIWSPARLTELLARWCELKPQVTWMVGIAVPNTAESRERLQLLGYARYFDPGTATAVNFEDALPSRRLAQIAVIIDRCRAGNFSKERLRDSLDQCFALAAGRVEVLGICERSARPWKRFSVAGEERPVDQRYERYVFRNTYQCGDDELSVERPRPALFSYNHPIGACPECNGFGKILIIDEQKCVPDHSKSIGEYALECWRGNSAAHEHRRLLTFCAQQKIPTDQPWASLTPEQRSAIFQTRSRTYCGVIPWFKYLEGKKYKMHVRVFLARYRGQVDCERCGGTRLKRDALAYQVGGYSIADIWGLPLGALSAWLDQVHADLRARGELPRELEEVCKNIAQRVRYLVALGLPYLTLDRQARTLSGGETQRVNLVSALGSNLISTHFVLDEPSVGLHARDTAALVTALRELTAQGNSLTVVEHDPECLEAADSIVELGPGAGADGGEVVFQGPTSTWRGLGMQPVTAQAQAPTFERVLAIRNARNRNLKSIDLDIPLNALVCLTGVSGSGKSSLLTEVLEGSYQRSRGLARPEEEATADVAGFDQLREVLLVDQSPLSKTPRANIATYTKIWDRVRELLAESDDAQLRGLTKSSFSFNLNAGRCPTCEGAGFIREDMQFLSDVFIPCDGCLGMRFQQPVLEVQYKGLNVHEILSLSVERCAEVFAHEPHIVSAASVLTQLGLGHLTVGHPLSELSGGEAQRLKLVPHITQGAQGNTLFLFDEPTTGLHARDVERLIDLFRSLRERGHSIVCVEHNLLLVAAADWIIDLGPEGGAGGGEVLKQGTPADFVADTSARPNQAGARESATASYLRDFVARYGGSADRPKRGKGWPKRSSASLDAARSAAALPSVRRAAPQAIQIRGAREHNLKNIDLDIPLHSLITLSGVSGSGKSTIAKDIVYAEGQRRYLDCLSPYARQFIKELKRPAIDDIRNIQPTICVYQHTFQPSALSTVGTMSEVYNFLRLLFAKVGVQYCPDHPEQSIAPLSAEQIAAEIKGARHGPVRLLAPVIHGKKGHHRAVFQRALEAEFGEVRVDGVFAAPSRFVEEGLTKSKPHSIEFVTGRFNSKTIGVDLITEAVRQALVVGGGTVIVVADGEEQLLSSERTCQVCKRGFFRPDPEDLSFNSRRGRCERCEGLGSVRGKVCPECGGARINGIGRNIRLLGYAINELTALSAQELREVLTRIAERGARGEVAAPIVAELEGKLKTLIELGLDHLALQRECATLSGGELQRLRLATAMGSPLSGATYIFDEPSAGLHPEDNKRLLGKLAELRDRGNTVIQIEHELDNIVAADHLIDIGPGAGIHGGSVVYQGAPQAATQSAASTTGRALLAPLVVREGGTHSQERLSIVGAHRNNVRGVSLTVPLKSLVVVAGVSGAGKSTLVHGVMAEAITGGKGGEGVYRGSYGTLRSSLPLERLLVVDQRPLGKTSRSTPASYLGIWDEIRKVFAETVDAKSRGWGPSFFSHNTGKGRCAHCKGQGEIRLEMNFLAEATVVCEECMGGRFSAQAELVKFRERSVSEVLKFTFEEARIFFLNHRRIQQVCRLACELGLGYLTLGQQSATLSGGESQRLKLVAELHLSRREHTVYILDEPTTGLHRSDVALLLGGLHRLVEQGHSVFVIEHDADTIAQADWVVELGPGAGERGGQVVFEGPPAQLIAGTTPWGVALRARQVLHEPLLSPEDTELPEAAASPHALNASGAV